MYSSHSEREQSPWEQNGKQALPGTEIGRSRKPRSSAISPLYSEYDLRNDMEYL